MRVIGFNFEKVSIERMKDAVEHLKITVDVDILDIDEIKTDTMNIKETMIQAKFLYKVKYEPGFAEVEIKGTVLLALGEQEAKEVLKEWKKKLLPEEFRLTFFNVVLRKAALKALHLEEDMNLPLHIQLPSLKSKDMEKSSKDRK